MLIGQNFVFQFMYKTSPKMKFDSLHLGNDQEI